MCNIFGFFFYKSLIWMLILLPLSIPLTIRKADEMRENKRKRLLSQFVEMVKSVNASMQAGYSMENAFIEAAEDLMRLYGKDIEIIKEIKWINRGIANNGSLTEMLSIFASKSGINEIADFAEIITVGKISGGNITEIMASYVKMIDEKMEVLQEIETMITARKYEQKIMNLVPFIILAYMDITSPGFLSVLYHNLPGNIIMTICLGIYILAVNMAEKIISIKV